MCSDSLFLYLPNAQVKRHPEWNEGSPDFGTVPACGDPSLRSG